MQENKRVFLEHTVYETSVSLYSMFQKHPFVANLFTDLRQRMTGTTTATMTTSSNTNPPQIIPISSPAHTQKRSYVFFLFSFTYLIKHFICMIDENVVDIKVKHSWGVPKITSRNLSVFEQLNNAALPFWAILYISKFIIVTETV